MRHGFRALVLVLPMALAFGCGNGDKNPNGNGGTCVGGVDFDGDGYGDGCEAGPDCNDADADFNVDCCYKGNEFPGCPCSAASSAPVSCFGGDPALAGVGACTTGEMSCDPETNKFSECIGGVAPSKEVCDNGVDNDCDGHVDEGVLSACENCMPGCDQNVVGDNEPIPSEDDDPNVDQDGTGIDPNGDIVLDSGSIETYFMWIANDGQGTVSKIDTRTGLEVARYPTVVPRTDPRLIEGDCRGQPCDKNAVQLWNAKSGSDAENRPSRTAIDFRQDCWLANRAHDSGSYQPTVTKFFNNNGVDENGIPQLALSDCKDRNGDGILQTSYDADGDGTIDVADPLEFFADDECIAATVMVGEPGGNARALAIDAGGYNVDFGGVDPSNPGNAWVGMYAEQAFYRVQLTFSGLQPVASTTRIPQDYNDDLSDVLGTNFHSYGAAIDSKGVLWAPEINTDMLIGFHTDSPDFSNVATTFVPESGTDYVHNNTTGTNSYGIVIDLDDKIWLASYSTQDVHRYDPETNVWTTFQVNSGNTRGVAIDLNGYVWAAIDSGGQVARIAANAWSNPMDPDPCSIANNAECLVYDVNAVTGVSTTGPVGVGVDFDGHVWLINRSTSNASKMLIDTANDLDGDGLVGDPAGVSIANKNTGFTANVTENLSRPYTYSDFTGLSLRAVTRPSGDYVAAMQGCPGGTEANWSGVVWDATVPLNTALQVFVQVGNDLATLDQQPYYGPWTTSPADLDSAPGPVPDATYLRLTLRLISDDRVTSPIVHSYSVQWTCPGEQIL